jgi:membrane protein insertase Oxa1/YidC/SpoIIIJ
LYWTINSVVTVAQQWVIHREDPATHPLPVKA